MAEANRFPVNPRKRKNARTICEVLRELYRDAETRGDAVSMARIDEAHDMAKRMWQKLLTYNSIEPIITSNHTHE